MQIKNIVASIMIIFFENTLAGAPLNKYSHKFVDKRFGEIVIGKGPHKLKKIKNIYGKGFFSKYNDQLCYFNEELNQYLDFFIGPDDSIEGILVSYKSPGAECKRAVTHKKGGFCSEKGICLGTSYSKLMKIYGKPHKVKRTKEEVQVEYHTDYKQDPQVSLAYDSSYKFKRGKLFELMVWDGE